MTFYGNLASTAQSLIASKGRALTITRGDEAVYDPATDTMTPPDEATSGTFQVVVLPASKGTIEAFDERLVNGTLIDESLRFVLAAAKGTAFAPKAGDVMNFDGSDWTVIGCTPLSPAGTALIYKMAVKK